MTVVIYVLDHWDDPLVAAHFEHSYNKKFGDMPTRAVGKYKDMVENCYISTIERFQWVKAGMWVKQQESFMIVSRCNKSYAKLVYQGDRPDESLGSLKCVPEREALKAKGYTYRPDLGQYWVAVEGNPDTVPPPEGW